jgi:hypothetical protein
MKILHGLAMCAIAAAVAAGTTLLYLAVMIGVAYYPKAVLAVMAALAAALTAWFRILAPHLDRRRDTAATAPPTTARPEPADAPAETATDPIRAILGDQLYDELSELSSPQKLE